MSDVTREARRAQLLALFDAAEHFNSDLTRIIGRDDDGKILFAAVFARGEDAEAIDTFLEMLDLRDKEIGEAGV